MVSHFGGKPLGAEFRQSIRKHARCTDGFEAGLLHRQASSQVKRRPAPPFHIASQTMSMVVSAAFRPPKDGTADRSTACLPGMSK